MAWDYSELSKAAKKAGGPEAYVNMLVEMSKTQGRKEMIPVVIVTTAVGAGITYLVTKTKERKRIDEELIEESKKVVVDDMNIFDEKANNSIQ